MTLLALFLFMMTVISSIVLFAAGMSSNPAAGARWMRAGMIGSVVFWTAFVVCMTIVIIRRLKS